MKTSSLRTDFIASVLLAGIKQVVGQVSVLRKPGIAAAVNRCNPRNLWMRVWISYLSLHLVS